MSVTYTAGYAAASPQPMTHARILWKSWAFTATSSGAATDHPADRVGVPDTASWWLSTTGAADRTLTLSFGALQTVDAVGLAGHNLGGDTVLLEGATNAGLTTWVTLATLTPVDDSSLLSLFASQNLYGVRIKTTVSDVDTATKISVAYVGQALAMPVPGYRSLGPVDLNMEVGINTYRTENGQLAGRFVQFVGLRGQLVFEHLAEAWVRSTFMTVLKGMVTKPFFLACRPSGYADDCSFAWTTKNVLPERSGPKTYMKVQMEVNAHAPSSLF